MQAPASTSQSIAVEDRVISLSEIAHKVVRSVLAVSRHKLLFAIVCGACILAGWWNYSRQPLRFESRTEVHVYSGLDFQQIEESLQSVWRRDGVLTAAAHKILSNHSSSLNDEAIASKVNDLRSHLAVQVVDGRKSGKPVSIQLSFCDVNADDAQHSLAEIVTAGVREFEEIDLAEHRHPIFHDSKRSQSVSTLRSLIEARDQLKKRLSVSMLQSSRKMSLAPDSYVPGEFETLRGVVPLPSADDDGKEKGMAGMMYRELLRWVAQPVAAPGRSIGQSESTRQLQTLNAQLLLQSMQDEIKYLRSRVALAELAGQPASPAVSVNRPLSRYLARFAIFGLLAGVVSVLLIDNVQDRFHSSADVESVLGLRRLATLPPVQLDELKLDSTDTQTAESFACISKVLETSPTPLQCIAVTSGGNGEGSAYVAFKLAAAAADSGKHTLLVDADLRTTELTDELGLQGAGGVSDLLAGRCELSASIQPAETAGGLDVLPCGKSTDQSLQLLASSSFEQLLEDLRQQYDQIVIHAPAAQKNADAAVIGRVSDGLLLVVHGGQSKRDVSVRSRRQLASFGVHVAGAVVIRNHSWKPSPSDWQYSGLANAGPAADVQNTQFNTADRADEIRTHDGPCESDSQNIDKLKLRDVA